MHGVQKNWRGGGEGKKRTDKKNYKLGIDPGTFHVKATTLPSDPDSIVSAQIPYAELF